MKITVTKKTLISSLCILLLGIVIGWCASWFTFRSLTNNTDVVIPDSLIHRENVIIDSLRTENEILKEQREKYKDSIYYVIWLREIEKEKIWSLPLDSGLSLFKERIGKYEKK